MAFEKQWFEEIWRVKGIHLMISFKAGNPLKARYVIRADGREFHRSAYIPGGSSPKEAAKDMVKQIAEQMTRVPLNNHAILAVDWSERAIIPRNPPKRSTASPRRKESENIMQLKPKTRAALDRWLSRKWDSAQPADEERFYKFVDQYQRDHGFSINEPDLRDEIKRTALTKGFPVDVHQENVIHASISLATKILHFLKSTGR